MPAKKNPVTKKTTAEANEVTTTGRGSGPRRREVTFGSGLTSRPLNPDEHGSPGDTEETTASKLRQEAEKGSENRY